MFAWFLSELERDLLPLHQYTITGFIEGCYQFDIHVHLWESLGHE